MDEPSEQVAIFDLENIIWSLFSDEIYENHCIGNVGLWLVCISKENIGWSIDNCSVFIRKCRIGCLFIKYVLHCIWIRNGCSVTTEEYITTNEIWTYLSETETERKLPWENVKPWRCKTIKDIYIQRGNIF